MLPAMLILHVAFLATAVTGAFNERGLFWSTDVFDPTVDVASVREIHVVSSNHLDVGFNSRACASTWHPTHGFGKPRVLMAQSRRQ